LGRFSGAHPQNGIPAPPSADAATDSRALADARLAKAQEATDRATVRALVDAARALLGGS
jgi:hypothetical protein